MVKLKFPAAAVAVCSVLLLLAAVFALSASPPEENSVISVFSSSSAPTGGFVLEVIDGATGAPIEGASVVLPLQNSAYATDKDGKTPEINAEIETNASYDALGGVTWGETCVFIYADGYLPYGLFNMRVEANRVRNGPSILMFPAKASTSGDPLIVAEAPDRQWAAALIEENRP